MPLTPSKLKELCERYGLSPSKKYGQNYLISDAPIRKMIQAAELSKDDTVVEIGPGFGILTLAIAPLVKKLIAFEIEKKLQAYWEEKIKQYPNTEIVWGNFLNMWDKETRNWKLETRIDLLNCDSLISNFQFPISYKVLANLPYSITSNALRVLLETEPKPEKIIVMVQKEVAERICAKPGDMSLLAVSVQYYGVPRIIAPVSRGNFWPVPGVDSAVVEISLVASRRTSPRPSPKRRGGDEFFRVVKAGFANKRKQLWKNLSVGLGVEGERVKAVVREVTGNEKVRAEELSVENWLTVTERLTK